MRVTQVVSSHELSLLRLVAQGLAGPGPWADDGAGSAGPVERATAVVEHLAAVQAQDLPGALASVALRAGCSRKDVVAALDAGRVVRSWPMRGTLHLTPARDLAWMAALMTPRSLAAAAKRRAELGLTDQDLVRAQDALVAALSGGGAMTRAQVLALWEEAGQGTTGGRGYHLIVRLAEGGVICQGPTADGEPQFVLLEEWVPEPRHLDREEALAEIALRYFRSHGPATIQDLARWTNLTMADARAGLAAVTDQLTTLESDGRTHYVDPAVPDRLTEHRAQARRTLALPGFDEAVLGYADRTCLVAPEHAQRLVPGNNGVFRNTIVHDGAAVGLWKWTGRGKKREVEVEWLAEVGARVRGRVPGLVKAIGP
ncbi:AlkZ family DNA glycosylase [Actinotalea sp. BY-33]|uniref:AlkZ family DNA glycosylase n=1 Tax=Actinotalea soli TaxID=2819234 RepID=A0A939RVL3_9CELL|nr:winged helix DNA-binding domain-containing protein [Actinotalea soli]MBO1751241.1 AlkZ family DNA glycosylase [Actinotalea soli]